MIGVRVEGGCQHPSAVPVIEGIYIHIYIYVRFVYIEQERTTDINRRISSSRGVRKEDVYEIEDMERKETEFEVKGIIDACRSRFKRVNMLASPCRCRAFSII